MKKLWFMLAMCVCTLASCSNEENPNPEMGTGVIKLNVAGTLKSLLGSDYLNLQSLKIVGPINGDDIKCLREMSENHYLDEEGWGKLTTLDLSEASIVEGGGMYYQKYGEGFYTSNNAIGEHMFSFTNLKNIILPNGVTSIGQEAFYNCNSLTSIEIPNSVTSIEPLAFSHCYSLTSIEIPNRVTSIEPWAFSSCYSLTSIKIPNSVTSIKNGAFSNCESLTSIKLPNNIRSIETSVFCYCI